MDLKYTLEKLLEPALNDLGLSLVQIQLSGSSQIKLRVMIERTDHTAMSMDDCVKASREISVLLDAEDPIENSYTLEVTSPGDDRPLIKPQDFERFCGEMIKCETVELIDGSKRFKGSMVTSSDIDFTLRKENGDDIVIRFDQIAKARLDPPKFGQKNKERK